MVSPGKPMPDAVIVEAIRTPIGKRGGSLKDWRPDELAAFILRALVDRTGIEPKIVEDVVLGCVTQIDEQGLNIGRIAPLVAGFPDTVPGTSVNRMCASGLQAFNFGAMEVLTGQNDVVIAGGVESMSRVPIGSDGGALSPTLLEKYELVPQGISADLVADKYHITREQMDEFSLWSHRKAVRAIDEGRFKKETVPVPVFDEGGAKRMFDTDEHPRRNTSLEKLASLPPAFKPDGRITAGNSSGINDGACAILLTNPERAKELGLEPRARFVATGVAGTNPTIMLDGTIPAIRKALGKANLKVDDIDLWEVNEAFASVPIATRDAIGFEDSNLNVNGGAIALGHPLGMSGARLITTMLHEMERQDLRYGLASLCIGFGMGAGTILERPT
jgi:acetyl-CoA acetyltransferase family protein